jgi:hypothetical protein
VCPLLLERSGAEVLKGRMASLRVVEDLEILEELGARPAH